VQENFFLNVLDGRVEVVASKVGALVDFSVGRAVLVGSTGVSFLVSFVWSTLFGGQVAVLCKVSVKDRKTSTAALSHVVAHKDELWRKWFSCGST